MSAFRWLLLENAKLKHDLQGRTVELGAISSLLAVCYDAVVEVGPASSSMRPDPLPIP